MIVIVDYGMGNMRSILKKFEMIKTNAIVSGDPNVLIKASKLVLPGVGHFAHGMENIRKHNLLSVLNKIVLEDKRPVLGVCLGMQLMAKHSEEGDVDGLGWFDAKVNRFNFADEKEHLRVPHVGWNTIKILKKECPLISGVEENTRFYFTHSYHFIFQQNSEVVANTSYGVPFPSIVQKENIYGTQFHPEKSHAAGLRLYENFCQFC